MFEFNDARLLTKEYQEHAGAKDGSTPYVGYNYDETASGGAYTKGLRGASVRYPNGRLVHTTYGSTDSTADAANRVAAINADSAGSPGTSLADYSYLGSGSFVQVDYAEPDLRYDLAHGGGDDPYDGVDRFGRVVDLLWYDYGSSTDAVRIQHGYDRAASRLYREDPVASAAAVHMDELYTYDGVNQLQTFKRGNLNGSKDALVAASMTFAHDWTLDPTGNWSTFKEDTDGDSTWDLNQSRTSNKANELTNITETVGPAWVTPAYNRAGNMTTIPKPADPTAGYTATYDAWNRLVKLVDGANTVAEYRYGGAKRRIVQKSYTGGSLDETRHFYYNEGWQCLEERIDSSTDPDRQFVWGKRYIDDLVLRDRDTSDPKNGTLDERLYTQQDANWNVTSVADATGAIQERYAYDPYGTPIFLTPAFATRASSNYEWETLYAGYRYESHTGVYHVRHRVYHALFGWLQRDPLGLRQDVNPLRYLRGMPVSRVDPTGLSAVGFAAAGPAIAVQATSFSYPTDPNKAAMEAWGFQFQWRIGFNAAADGKLYYQKVHSRLTLLDTNKKVIHRASSEIVDIAPFWGGGAGGGITDTQSNNTNFGVFVKTHVSADPAVCFVRFRRSATMRLVDSITVDPVGPVGPRPYDPATDPQGMVHLHYWDSDGKEGISSNTGGGPGEQLFEAITSPGANEFYRLTWTDKVDSTVQRPSRFSLFGEIKLIKKGTLKFSFPDKAALDPTVTGGIDRSYGPVTVDLW